MSVLENLLTFNKYTALKLKVINTILTPNTPINNTISVVGVPDTTVYITGFLYNYIGTSSASVYDYWDLQIALPKSCIVKCIKQNNVTSYATVLCLYII